MADPAKVAEKDGAHKTNWVTVERVEFLADGYQIDRLDGEEIGHTGRLKVLRIRPVEEQSEAPRFLSRWDDGRDQSLDFNLVDRHDNQIGKLPHGHHPDRLGELEGHRQYQVELGRDEKHIVFRGIVEVALGFRIRLGDTLDLGEDLQHDVIRAAGPGPQRAEMGGPSS
jgi:hypothetical protein